MHLSSERPHFEPKRISDPETLSPSALSELTLAWDEEDVESRETPHAPCTPFEMTFPPDIGEGGRFIAEEIIVQKKDPQTGALLFQEDGQPVTQAKLVHPYLDFSRPPTHKLFESFKEFSPFHVRTLIGEYHYEDDHALEARGFPLPRHVRVHGRTFTHEGQIGGGGMGDVILYVDETNGDPIVLKLIGSQGKMNNVRALEEVAVHALVHPASLAGERPALLSSAMQMADHTQLSQTARGLHDPNVWEAMTPEEQLAHGEALRDLVVGFIDAVWLQPDSTMGHGMVGCFLPYELGGTLRDSMATRSLKLSDPEGSPQERDASRQEVTRENLADALRMAQAAFFVHALGVTHRDFKPENFLRGEDGKLRLADFGIARKETFRILRGLDQRTKIIHERLVEDAQRIYRLGEQTQGQKVGGLSPEDQTRIWNWLRDFVRYQHDPELNVPDRLQLMKDLITRLGLSKDALLATYRKHIPEHSDGDIPWSFVDIDGIESLPTGSVSITAEHPTQQTISGDAALDEQLSEEYGSTSAGMIVGTPRYLAPEAARGLTGKNVRGPKEDTFAMGVLLMELFRSGNVLGDNAREKLRSRAVNPDVGLHLNLSLLSNAERVEYRWRTDEKIAAMKRARPSSEFDKPISDREQKQVQIEVLMGMPGTPRILGLITWCTMKAPSDRPSDLQVLESIKQVQTDLA